MSRPSISSLLVIGVTGFICTMAIGAALRRGFYATMIAIPVVMAVIALALIAFGAKTAVAVALLGLWGFVATAAPVGLDRQDLPE